MEKKPPFRQRKRIRLPDHDYRYGSYFITVCCRDRHRFLGEIKAGKMISNEIGIQAKIIWDAIPLHNPNVTLDEFVVMPNHIHGILHLGDNRGPGQVVDFRPNVFGNPIAGSLSTVVRQYKARVTQWARSNGHADFGWQGRFYESWIREEKDLERIREYISSNPSNWAEDEFFYS